MRFNHVTALIVLLPCAAFASVYTPVSNPEEIVVKLALPYTLGTHEGKISRISGSLNFEMTAPEKSTGSFEVNVADIRMDGDSITCHMRESIGLDYSISDFPKSHVCDGNQLPPEGPNSIKFPTVSWKWSGASVREGVIVAKGDWQIHGARQPSELALRWEQTKPDLLRLQGETTLSLQAFGIVVKPAFFISAKDELKVILDVLLRKEHPKK